MHTRRVTHVPQSYRAVSRASRGTPPTSVHHRWVRACACHRCMAIIYCSRMPRHALPSFATPFGCAADWANTCNIRSRLIKSDQYRPTTYLTPSPRPMVYSSASALALSAPPLISDRTAGAHARRMHAEMADARTGTASLRLGLPD